MTDNNLEKSLSDTNMAVAEEEKSAPRKRGKGFPVVPLNEAAEILKEAGKYGFEHSQSAFASFMGHGSLSSGHYRQRLAAFRDWQLISGKSEFMMTEVARMIAVPISHEAERSAMQEAFGNCKVFVQLIERSRKNTPLEVSRLRGIAVHELGVAPARADKFIASFVESALAAELAEENEEGKVIFWDNDGEHGATDTKPVPENLNETATTTRRPDKVILPPRVPSRSDPTVCLVWPISDGNIVFQIYSESALPANSFGELGKVVERLEALATTLGKEIVGELSDKDGS